MGEYATVNGLRIYLEIHGEGKPLVLLHGAFGTAEGWGPTLPKLTKIRKVVLIEQQAHGHTFDREGPLSYGGMVADTAALLGEIGIPKTDFFGFSDGGIVALGLAIRHPDLVDRMAVLGANFGRLEDTMEPEIYDRFVDFPDDFASPFLKEPYDRVAPDPGHWPVLVRKIKAMAKAFEGYSDGGLRKIRAKTLVMAGDRDAPKAEHAVEMFRAIPDAQLAIFPDCDHLLLAKDPDRVLATLIPFLEEPRKPPATV